MAQALKIVDLPTNEEEDASEPIPFTLLLKPFGFKPLPPKAIIPRLLQAWNIRKGVTITPKKYADDILTCIFKDKKDMLFVERDRAWSSQGAHLMTSRWDKGKSLEEIPFDSVTFWVQLRGIPPEMIYKKNITRLAERARQVIDIDWKDSPSFPKWYVTPRALIKIPVAKPLCLGRLFNWKSGALTWVYFKYEHLKTFCYDCGILGHDQAHCASETSPNPNLYGPWLRFDPNPTYQFLRLPSSRQKTYHRPLTTPY
ncbi:hypothetical protein CRG98_000963 [Punica granatum]|uniref:Zinc knuckle CX2CX4HX4C domain-containing protein n=1 Tax=Punica granatum TaxID=22663 RepID=A0A2I0LED5_PUNGR|nr:hypothetical protein CRG98_000963 [Punica granatum]